MATNNRPVMVRVTGRLYEALEARAAAEDRRMGEWVRRLLRRELLEEVGDDA